MSERELIDLLEQARSRNLCQNITGMLMYTRREFVQILEGSEEDVREVFASIEKDDRHTSVDVFYSGTMETRAFGNWTMAFKLETDGANLPEEFEELAIKGLPCHLLHDSPNIGKELFLSLRADLR
jgi:Sensors of blue-light using FAD